MSVSPEDLAAFADGELDAVRRAEVAAAIEADPALAAQVEAHRALKARLAAHFAPVLDEPLPNRLTAPLTEQAHASAEIVDFAGARAAREARRRLPRWSWIAGPALAASVALAFFLPRGGGGGAGYASDQLADALDRQLVATQPADAPTRILLSFRDDAGAYCRAFSGAARSGIACRDARGWKLEEIGEGQGAREREFRQAGSSAQDLMAVAQKMARGDALDADEERAASARGWR